MNLHQYSTQLLSSAFTLMLLAGTTPTYAAELNLSNVPLFLDSGVEPNILLLIDDSGSMNSLVLLSDGARSAHPISTENIYELNWEPTSNDNLNAILPLCSGYNTLAYDPKTIYTPWSGVDKNEKSYTDRTLKNALDNPYEARVIDVSNHIYSLWVDKNHNNRYDPGECTETPTLVNKLNSTDQKNYANWYSYYRTRAHVMKKAALALVDNSSARIGLGTMHNNKKVGTIIKDMNDGDGSTRIAVDAKISLQKNIGKITAEGRTPIRRTLQRAGEYYQNGSGALFDTNHNPGSPILSAENGGQCQLNFSILMTDGYAWDDKPHTDYAEDEDSDGELNTIADIAMKYYEADLAPNLADAVPNTNGGTHKMHQHMITYSVAFGVNGTLTCQPGTIGCNDKWPVDINYVGGEDPKTIDDLWHAAVNGRGQYLNAADPQALIRQMQAAMDNIEARTSSSAAVAANSATLSQDTVVYQALFNTGDWRGDLQAMPISIGPTDTRDACRDVAKGKTCVSADWHASAELNKLNFDTGRTILTYNPNSSEDSKGIPFRWPADYTNPGDHELGTAQTALLLANASSGEEASYGQALVNYLRGDNSNEGVGFNFRTRATALGDIINSAPTFVGPPRFNYPDNMEAAPYSTYLTEFAGRTKIIYVGGNDGMLHGFNATTGAEEIAYVPSIVLPKLEKLSEHEYTNQGGHLFFVDGSPTVGDAYFGSSWRTVLVGGLNAGGQGIYALDVTDPTKFTEDQDNINDIVLWEFTDADLGYTYSQPDIVKMNNGKWAAIFGNGYNNTEADGNASTTGQAYLYVVDLETGSLIKKISTGVGSVDTPNGLATATPADVDGDGKADYLYAGDLEGNLWRFNVTSADPESWSATNIFTAVAPEAGNPRQPITSRPSVSFHPNAQKEGFMVFFGTGRYIDVADSVASGQNTQTFYGIWDELTSTPPTFHGNRTADENDSTADYLKQKIIAEPVISGTGYSAVLRISTKKPIDWSKHHGWYIDLVNTATGDNRGERQITNSLVRGDRVVFTTMMPNDIACDFGGNSFLMELSVNNGGPLSEPPLDINNDGVIDENDFHDGQVPSGIILDGIISDPTVLVGDPTETKIFSGSTGEIKSVEEKPPTGLKGKRKSWTEVMQ